MTAKAIDMSSTAAYTGQRIKYGLNTLQSLSAITSRAYGSKLKISEENSLSTYDVSEGLAYSSADANYAFDSALGICISRVQLQPVTCILSALTLYLMA
jgi:hypothetical protein